MKNLSIKVSVILGICALISSNPSFSQHVLDFYIPSCPWTSISEKTTEDFSFNVFPNPVTDFLTIEFNNTSEHQKAVISIVNIIGQTLIQKELSFKDLSNRIIIDVANLPKGIYISKISLDNKILHKLFVIY